MLEPSRLALTSTPSMTGSCCDVTLPVSATLLCALAAGGTPSAVAPVKAAAIRQRRNDVLWGMGVVSLDTRRAPQAVRSHAAAVGRQYRCRGYAAQGPFVRGIG